ncbi:undecaprenyldiphospho-muramoylpentapeptide beta-N-acetylglucosaminyltransferase [Micrococcus lylae]|uniref:UDP-N-acetylglucosamine--N-acetylmuramyl-(pentapeptide) pyrophosphoryl-undecaprenol N-acetylglucosamine transferase n=1 Tax=Micrococcus lylae TaxID=1273 RepID=A0ABY2K3U8_9MICC|nr:undecaprenyldiphospho-muramoylpentapeptide beta-N-acetylglucosaminyltransferase [Micrococcus lylae]TFI00184.1 undecaprenyldiphospho-muramoylpentapeptide beta-N-acetylglucosaminyltransferase [Micrococcus lylae]
MTVPSTERPLRVVLAGGGTAGHISPMLSIARALQEPQPGPDGTVPVPAVCTMVGTESGMETRLVPDAGFELDTIGRVPFPRRPSMDVLRFPGRFRAAIDQAKAILRRREADVVVGVGGYVSTPMYRAAKSLGIPTVVHEANARPGMANRWGARSAARVAVALKGTPLKGSEWVGMPMRPEVSSLDRAEARGAAAAELGLDPERTTVVVTGGSSGALSVNRTVQGALDDLLGAGVQVLHLTGRGKEVTDSAGQRVVRDGYHQREYLDRMEQAYAVADLIVARSGAGTVCEVCAVGLPAVFVPLPIGNGEQALNAEQVVADGGALLVRDDTFSPEWVRRELIPLATSPERLSAMAAASAAHGVRDADQKMARLTRAAAAEGAHR